MQVEFYGAGHQIHYRSVWVFQTVWRLEPQHLRMPRQAQDGMAMQWWTMLRLMPRLTAHYPPPLDRSWHRQRLLDPTVRQVRASSLLFRHCSSTPRAHHLARLAPRAIRCSPMIIFARLLFRRSPFDPNTLMRDLMVMQSCLLQLRPVLRQRLCAENPPVPRGRASRTGKRGAQAHYYRPEG